MILKHLSNERSSLTWLVIELLKYMCYIDFGKLRILASYNNLSTEHDFELISFRQGYCKCKN